MKSGTMPVNATARSASLPAKRPNPAISAESMPALCAPRMSVCRLSPTMRMRDRSTTPSRSKARSKMLWKGFPKNPGATLVRSAKRCAKWPGSTESQLSCGGDNVGIANEDGARVLVERPPPASSGDLPSRIRLPSAGSLQLPGMRRDRLPGQGSSRHPDHRKVCAFPAITPQCALGLSGHGCSKGRAACHDVFRDERETKLKILF